MERKILENVSKPQVPLVENLLSRIKNKDSKELLKGGSFAMAYRIANMLFSYALLYYISFRWGKQTTGAYNIGHTWISVLGLISILGLNAAIVSYTSQFLVKKNYVELRHFYFRLLRLGLLLGSFLGVILFFLSAQVANIVYNNVELTPIFQITAFSLPFVAGLLLNIEFIRAHKQVKVSELLRNFFTTVVTIILLIVLSSTLLESMTMVVLSYAIALFVTYVFSQIKALMLISNIEVGTEKLPGTGRYLRGSVSLMLNTLMMFINGRVNILLLGFFVSTGEIGVFSVAFKLSVLIEFVMTSMKSIAMPQIAHFYKEGKREKLLRTMQFSAKIILAAALPATLLLLIFPEKIMSLFGAEFMIGSNVLRLFAVTHFISAASGLVGAFMNMTGNQKIFARLLATSFVTNVVLNLILVPNFGIEGSALATLISTAIWNVPGALFIYKKYKIPSFYWPLAK